MKNWKLLLIAMLLSPTFSVISPALAEADALNIDSDAIIAQSDEESEEILVPVEEPGDDESGDEY